jgi:hypothetical protein
MLGFNSKSKHTNIIFPKFNEYFFLLLFENLSQIEEEGNKIEINSLFDLMGLYERESAVK